MIVDDRSTPVNSKTQPPTAPSRDLRCCRYIDPSCSLPKATNHILRWIGTAWCPQKPQKCGITGLLCLDKPVSGQGEGGVLHHPSQP